MSRGVGGERRRGVLTRHGLLFGARMERLLGRQIDVALAALEPYVELPHDEDDAQPDEHRADRAFDEGEEIAARDRDANPATFHHD